MALGWTTVFQMIYDLFVTYTFGSLELTAIALFIILGYTAYRLNVSADGWVIVLAGYGIIVGMMFMPGLALPALTAIAMGFLIYSLLRRFNR